MMDKTLFVKGMRRVTKTALHILSTDCVFGRAHRRSILFQDVLAAFCRALPGRIARQWVVLKILQKLSLGHHCVLCASVGNEDPICKRCMDLLPWNHCYCECCGQPVAALQPPGVVCADCQRNCPRFHRARAPLRYAFPVDTALKALKFKRQLMYAPAFARLLLPTLDDEFPNVDALIPVPLHRVRHAIRGFNQAVELAKLLATHSGLPINHQTRRIRSTATQAGLSADARRRNLRHAFEVRGALQSRYPLIIDDVMTTGATCDDLAAALTAAGAQRVGVLTVARATTQSLR